MIVVIDCKISNLGSVVNIVKKVAGAPPVVSSRPEIIADATGLILPGVGAFDQGMRRLRETGIEAALTEAVRVRGTPLLGICLGMQMLTQGSEEGSERGQDAHLFLAAAPAAVRGQQVIQNSIGSNGTQRKD